MTPAEQPWVRVNAPPPPGSNTNTFAIEVEISDTQGHLEVDPRQVDRLVRQVLEGEEMKWASISVALVDDTAIHAVNRAYLGHDEPTDVISFAFSGPGEGPLTGEIVVSAERARSVALRHGLDPHAELALYLVHGLLHLCGHDDLTDTGAEAMRRREGEVLAGLGLTNTFPLAGEGSSHRARERERARANSGLTADRARERESARWLD